jgi:hypothetical protein
MPVVLCYLKRNSVLLLLWHLRFSAVPQVLEGVTPQVQFVKVVSDELVELMGSEGSKDLNPGQPQVILMAGLQVGLGFSTWGLGFVQHACSSSGACQVIIEAPLLSS